MCKSLREYGLFEVVDYVPLDQKERRIATIVVGIKRPDEYYVGVSIKSPKEKSINYKLARQIARGRAEKAFKQKQANKIYGIQLKKKHKAEIESAISDVVSHFKTNLHSDH